MKTNFANFMEAERYLRKHLDLPKNVRFKSIWQSYVEPANNKHPPIVALHQGYMLEYHGHLTYAGVVPREVPYKQGSQWTMRRQYDQPWIFVDTTNWKEISEEEFINRVNKILE